MEAQAAVNDEPKVDNLNYMSLEGIDVTAESVQTSPGISWHTPHPIFVIILVGPDEIPFGIQKDLLCAQSPYYREEFAKGEQNQVEHLVRLPDTDVDTFGCFQNFVYTGAVYDKANGREIPDYPLLMNIWKLATTLKMEPLRLAVLDVMADRRQQTSCIPGTPLLVQAWKETEEGSGLRVMLIQWAAEHMRTSPDIRNAFAKSLPQEILSELVIVMSELPPPPTPVLPPAPTHHAHVHAHAQEPTSIEVHHPRPSIKRSRKSDVGPTINGIIAAGDEPYEVKPPKKPRRSEPAIRKPPRKSTLGSNGEPITLSPDYEMAFCRDLINRMLSGPGFWTRLVGPFKNPVDPALDNVPNYLTVVKRPMDLRTIHGKMARGEYEDAKQFEADVRLIFQNCYEYWTENDAIFKQCGDFEKYFNEKWNARHKWQAPSIKSEVVE